MIIITMSRCKRNLSNWFNGNNGNGSLLNTKYYKNTRRIIIPCQMKKKEN